MKTELVVCWFRRDLRLEDNAALYYALELGLPVLPIFIFDTNILNQLEDKHDKRVAFIHAALSEMQTRLVALGSSMEVYYGNPLEVFAQLLEKYQLKQVFANHDYEPSAIARDDSARGSLEKLGIEFESFKDQVIFEKKEILTNSNTVFSIFTPYKNNWLKTLQEKNIAAYDCDPIKGQLSAIPKSLQTPFPSLESMGFSPTGIETYLPPGSEGGQHFLEDFLHRIDQYQIGRDFPAIKV